jgi:hypothetical protein
MADERLPPTLRQAVTERARGCCEYCRSQERFAMQAFALEHVVPRSLGGETGLGNLALACQGCNLRKGPNLTGIDPRSGAVVRLFNPRRHKWARHFRWEGPILRGRTPVGRTTVVVLGINLPHRVRLRQALIDAGFFPPD